MRAKIRKVTDGLCCIYAKILFRVLYEACMVDDGCVSHRPRGECLRFWKFRKTSFPIVDDTDKTPSRCGCQKGPRSVTTNTKLKALEGWLAEQDEVEHITTTAGKGLQRFMLTYAPEKVIALRRDNGACEKLRSKAKG